MDFDSTVTNFQRLFELIGNNLWSTTLTAIGLILLAIGTAFGGRALKSDPQNTPAWLKSGLFFCLIGGVGFAAAGPTVALVGYWKYPIARVSASTAFDNLETNARISWLIRLIPFDPDTQPTLSIAHLTQLGPPEQKFTFVAAYDELVGYGVDEAVRMIGGVYYSGERVSAIIFPVAGRQLFPANARGLLQVIKNLESDAHTQIATPFLRGMNLSDDENTDLSRANALNYWRWDNYFSYYPHYCQMAQTFRCGLTYSAHNYLSGPNIDWHPLGMAQKDTSRDPCDHPEPNYCAVSDSNSAPNSWKSMKAKFLSGFGSRVFLIQNLTLESIKDRVLIDFGEPEKQYIPDIGLRSSSR